MKPIRHIRRVAAALAGLACAWLGLAVTAPAALAQAFPPRPPGWDKHPPLLSPRAGIHTVVAGGMPGWQITLIAVGAALTAAMIAVLVDRAWTSRRKSAVAGRLSHVPTGRAS